MLSLLKKILSLFSVLFVLGISNIGFAQSEIDSLMNVLQNAPEDTNRIILLNDLAWKIKTSDKKKAIKFSKEAIELSEKLNYNNGISKAYRGLGTIFYMHGEYGQSYENYKKGLEFNLQNGNKQGAIKANTNLGNVFYVQGNYNKALEYYFAGLKLSEELGDKKGIASSYSTIGLIYHAQENYKDALSYCEKSLIIREEIEDKSGLATINYYMGVISEEQNKLDTALIYYQTSLKISEEIGRTRQIAVCYESIGNILLAKERTEEVLEYYEKSLKIREESNNRLGIANVYSRIGVYYINTKQYNEAINYLEKSMAIAEELGLLGTIQTTSSNLSIAYAEVKNYKKAFENQVLFKEMADSLKSKENTKKITQLEMQYEFDKKQKMEEIEQQKKDAVQAAELKRQKSFRNFLLLGLVLVFAFAIFLYRSNRFKQKANAMLSSQNEEIKRQSENLKKANKEISDKNKQITDSINYAGRIQTAILPPHDLFEKHFPEYFIFFRPRDIVSGDYYWLTEKGDKVIVAAADCTGHGVPGAFLSMLGIAFLNEIVNKHHEIEAGDILNILREQIKSSLHQTQDSKDPKDGMDIALCSIDLKKMEVEFSGAHNPLVIIRNKPDAEIEEIKANRMPVAIYRKERPFDTHTFKIKKGDSLYMFSDGFPDQIGGEKNRKFMRRRLKEIFLEMTTENKDMKEQYEILDKEFKTWKQHLQQVDDVLVLGIKV